MELKNKRIVITGATSGIGKQLMIQLSKYEGVRIIAVGRKMRNIPIAMNIIPFKADISIKEEVDALFNFAQQKLGGIDIFIANAGYVNTNEPTGWNDIDNIFKTNTISPIYSVQKMIESHLEQQEYLVAITISCLAKLSLPFKPLYVATKSALHGFIKSLRYTLPSNGHVSAIYPTGVIHTSFFEDMTTTTNHKNIVPGKKISSQKMARIIIKGIEKNKKEIYSSFCAKIKIILYQMFPFIQKRHAKQL